MRAERAPSDARDEGPDETAILTIDRDGKATLFDLATGASTTPAAPTGATFADVAFGQTILDETGGAWIVGPTRTTATSDIALRLASDGTIVARKLLRARKSAAATWVNGRGLLIGYSDDMLGLELLAPSATAATPLPFPPDPRAGGVLVPLDGARVLRIAEEFGITDINLVKPGVGETTRVLLRRVPWQILVRPDRAADLEHVKVLAAQRGVPVVERDDLPYSCIGLIKPAGT